METPDETFLQETSVNAIVEEPVWNTDISKKLESIVNERENAVSLFKAGLEPVKTVLLSGPPGVGKNNVRTLACCKVKFTSFNIGSLICNEFSFGKKTGNNIKSVMDYAKEKPCVLLLDEFDAVAKRRDDDRDVGELKTFSYCTPTDHR
ncbi:AAA family ATPase [Escherichia coli]